MIIDMHTHAFPDKIAEKTIEVLAVTAAKAEVYPSTNGTLDQLRGKAKEAGIDISVVLPVATRIGQFEKINQFAKYMNECGEDIISFGGIHPLDEDIEGKIQYIKSIGLKGIKIHPDYQEMFISSPEYINLICECQKNGLRVVTHAGKDPISTDVHCAPKMALEMLNKVYEKTNFTEPFFVFAHLGGMDLFDDVEKYLVGTNCYLDLSHAFERCEHEQLLRIIKNHGADKILFATDVPWRNQKEYVRYLEEFSGITKEEKEMIFYKNAMRLLNLS